MKNGFTLAEVLITIMIIAVIAALILPTLLTGKSPSVELIKIQTHKTIPSGW